MNGGRKLRGIGLPRFTWKMAIKTDKEPYMNCPRNHMIVIVTAEIYWACYLPLKEILVMPKKRLLCFKIPYSAGKYHGNNTKCTKNMAQHPLTVNKALR